MGKKTIKLEPGIEISMDKNQELVIKKSSQLLKVFIPKGLKTEQKEGQLFVICEKQDNKTRSLYGLTRTLIQNAVTGLSKGWSKSLELNGVGYKANLSGKKLELNLGYSHPIVYNIPQGIDIKIEKQTKLHVTGADKELVGLTAHQIRSYRPVEPYLAKGIKYSNEHVRRKAGKSGGGDKK